jgi:hypothetical protein
LRVWNPNFGEEPVKFAIGSSKRAYAGTKQARITRNRREMRGRIGLHYPDSVINPLIFIEGVA